MVVHALEQPIDRVLDTLEHNPSYLPKSLYSISNNRDSHSPGHKDVTKSHTPLYHDQLRSLGSYSVLNYSKVVSTRLLLSLTIVNCKFSHTAPSDSRSSMPNGWKQWNVCNLSLWLSDR